MEEKKISFDLHENSKISRIFQLIFGIACIAISVALLFNFINTGNPSMTNIVVVVFLLLFGVWEILVAANITGRYIIISTGKIVLKERYLGRAKTFQAGDLKEVEFKPLSFKLHLRDGADILVRLGNYYSETSVDVLESVEQFSRDNNITIKGIDDIKK